MEKYPVTVRKTQVLINKKVKMDRKLLTSVEDLSSQMAIDFISTYHQKPFTPKEFMTYLHATYSGAVMKLLASVNDEKGRDSAKKCMEAMKESIDYFSTLTWDNITEYFDEGMDLAERAKNGQE